MTFDQNLRNKIYAVLGSAVAILTVVGVIDQATGDQALSIGNVILDNVENIFALVGLVTAFVKSLPSRTVTLDVPAKVVDTVVTTDGDALAGPANPAVVSSTDPTIIGDLVGVDAVVVTNTKE